MTATIELDDACRITGLPIVTSAFVFWRQPVRRPADHDVTVSLRFVDAEESRTLNLEMAGEKHLDQCAVLPC